MPTGSTPGKRPAKKARRDKRNSKGSGGTGLVVIGLVIGLCFIGAALISRSSSGAEATAESTTTAAPTTTTTTTTTAAATTTTTKVPPGQWQAVHATDKIRYEVPPDWITVPQIAITYGSDDYEDYAVLRHGATYTTTACTKWPVAAGVYLDESTGPTVAQATKYAKGLATVAFGRPFEDSGPSMTVASSRHLDGDGWMGREIVVHAVATTADCDLSAGVVALLALSTDDEPDRTVMVAAYSGTDSLDGPQGADEATLRKIVESVSVTS